MKKEIKFDQIATKAALSLSDELRQMISDSEATAHSFFDKLRDISNDDTHKCSDRDKEEYEWIATQASLKAELFKASLEELRKQIETQNFNF